MSPTPTPSPVPAWKFWHPLPFWQVFLIALAIQFVCILAIIAIREGLGLAVPVGVGTGIGGALMVVAIFALVARRRGLPPSHP